MTARRPVDPAPGPLETCCRQFDALLGTCDQRESCRRFLAGLLLSQERNKILTALATTEPVVGAQQPPAQSLQQFLSESTRNSEAVTQRRVEVLCTDPLTAPTPRSVLVIDEHGDRKWGTKAALVGRHYLTSLSKTDKSVGSVTSLWADEGVQGVYCPHHVEPHTPAPHFARGKADPRFCTKRQIAAELVRRALAASIPCRAVMAASFYGEDKALRQELCAAGGVRVVGALDHAIALLARVVERPPTVSNTCFPFAVAVYSYSVGTARWIRHAADTDQPSLVAHLD